MNICIPVTADNGLASPVSAHFGSAPFFMIVDSDSLECRAVANGNKHHVRGRCSPLQSLQGEHLDAAVVGGIGPGALNKLEAANVPVFLARHKTVEEVLAAARAGQLTRVRPGMACGHGHGHGHGRGCGHH